MTIAAQFDDGEQYHLASNKGWSEFGQWVDGLDVARYGSLVQLWEHGVSEELPALESQLATALADDPPESADVERTAALLLETIEMRGTSDVLLTTNGMTADDGSDEDGIDGYGGDSDEEDATQLAFRFKGPRTGAERIVSSLAQVPKSVRAKGDYEEFKRERKKRDKAGAAKEPEREQEPAAVAPEPEPSKPKTVQEKLAAYTGADEAIRLAKQSYEKMDQLPAAEQQRLAAAVRGPKKVGEARSEVQPYVRRVGTHSPEQRQQQSQRMDEAFAFINDYCAEAITREYFAVNYEADRTRACYTRSEGLLKLNPGASVKTIVHEYGHHLERQPEIREVARAFVEQRSAGQKLRPIGRLVAELEGDDDLEDDVDCYRADEVGYMIVPEDLFPKTSGNAYVGKVYERESSEVISMGVELFYEDPVRFAAKDPEYFKMIRAILDGHIGGVE